MTSLVKQNIMLRLFSALCFLSLLIISFLKLYEVFLCITTTTLTLAEEQRAENNLIMMFYNRRYQISIESLIEGIGMSRTFLALSVFLLFSFYNDSYVKIREVSERRGRLSHFLFSCCFHSTMIHRSEYVKCDYYQNATN